MKKALGIIGVIIIMAIGAFIVLSPKSDDASSGTTSTQTKFAAIQTEIKNGASLIDVRTPSEYAAGHFANATNFDSVKVEAGQLPDFAKDTKIYLYCHSGRRAGIVLAAMKKAGFTKVSSLGGVTDVEALGGTLQK